MADNRQTFANTLKLFEYKFDMRTAFDDFLSMAICAFGQQPGTGKSYDEALYLETIGKYKQDKALCDAFPKMLACLVGEMEKRMGSTEGWDVLGETYEQHFSRKGLSQFFTPWHVCKFMAECACEDAKEKAAEDRPLRILDPSCGSGRTLMAASRVTGPKHGYYGIDVDHTCARMTAINLFLSGLFRSETMCSNALDPGDFRVSYRASFLPFGLFRIADREASPLWHMNQRPMPEPKRPPPDLSNTKMKDGRQLTIF